MSKSPMSQYLSQIAEEGSYDSSGAFTVGEKQAFEKLGAFQLPRPSAWVLKVVQAAVQWKATELEVKQGRAKTSFAMTGPRDFDLDKLQTALMSVSTDFPAYISHLVIALRAAGFGQNRKFLLHVYQDGARRTLIWDGESLRRNEKIFISPLRCLVQLQVNFQLKPLKGQRSKSTVEIAAQESRELNLRASCCPVSLTLDGRKLNTLSPPEPYGPSGSIAQLCLAWSPAASSGRPGLTLPDNVKTKEPWVSLRDRLTDRRVFLLMGNTKVRASEFLLRLSYHYQTEWVINANAYTMKTLDEKSWVHWVSDGVVCRSEPLKGLSPARLDLYLPAEGLPTDISGLTVNIATDEAQQREAAGFDFAGEAVNLLLKQLAKHSAPPIKVGGLLGSGAALAAFSNPGALIIAAGVGVIFSPAFVMAGIEYYRHARYARILLRDCEAQVTALGRAMEEHRRSL